MGAATPAAEAIARNGVKLKGFAGSGVSHAALDAGVNDLRSIRVAQRLLATGVGKQVFSLEADYSHETLYLKGRGECCKRLVLANDDSRSVISK